MLILHLLWSLIVAVHAGVLDSITSLNQEIDKTSLHTEPNLKLSSGLKENTYNGGDEIELRCEAIGSPPPVFAWTFNGKSIVGSADNNLLEKLRNIGKQTIETSVTVSKIRIPCAEKRHRGRYTCIVTNGYTTEQSMARISVAGSSSCQKKSHPPQIVQHTESRFELSGNSAQLFCRSIGATQTVWYNSDRVMLNHKEGYEVLDNGDLMIKKGDWEHMGVYTCVASNKDGETRAETFFYPTAPEGEEDDLMV